MRPFLALLLLVGACGGGDPEPETTTTEPPPATTTTTGIPATTSTTVATTSTTTIPTTTTTLDPDWWSTDEIRGFNPDFRAPRFSELRMRRIGTQVIQINVTGGMAVIYRSGGAYEDWVSRYSNPEVLVSSQISSVEVDGKPGTSMRLLLPANSGAPEEDWCGEPCAIIFDLPDYGWAIIEEQPEQMWLVELDEGTLVFLAYNPDDLESLVDLMNEWIDGIEWK